MRNLNSLPVLAKVENAGIPVRKLNTIEQKNYRQYADVICEKIKYMLKEVKSAVLAKYEADNRNSIIDKLVKSTKAGKYAEEAKVIADKIIAVNKKSKAIIEKCERAISKLEVERDAAIAKLKEEEMLPLIEEFNKHRNKLSQETDIRSPYTNSMKIRSNKEYEYEDETDEDELYGRPKKQITLEYPAINLQEVTGGYGLSGKVFVHQDAVSIELDKIMEPAKNEFTIAELKLEQMEQAVKEVMMFDGDRMDEAFRRLLEFRDSIQNKHMEVVKGIDPSKLEV